MDTLSFRQRLLALLILLLPLVLQAATPQRVEAVDFGKDDFVFPDDIKGAGPHVVFLGMATDQDNGTYQGEALIAWHKALQEAGVIPGAATAWHFSVIDNVPFFVKGLVRRGIAKTYVDLLPPNQGAVLYVKDLQKFAAAAELVVDGKPTVALYTPEQGLTEIARGAVSAEGVAAVQAALAAG